MMNWTDMVMYEERYKDYVREAARERLVQQAKAGQPKGLSFLARVSAWMERRLIASLHKSNKSLAGSSRV